MVRGKNPLHIEWMLGEGWVEEKKQTTTTMKQKLHELVEEIRREKVCSFEIFQRKKAKIHRNRAGKRDWASVVTNTNRRYFILIPTIVACCDSDGRVFFALYPPILVSVACSQCPFCISRDSTMQSKVANHISITCIRNKRLNTCKW